MSGARTVGFLVKAQHRTGSWTDFLLAPGPSDAWVTAYTGTALALAADDHLIDADTRSAAGQAADAAARWLLRGSADGTWGWNLTVRPDADSTAWAVRLLALRGWPLPAQALGFLDTHGVPTGYRTYRDPTVSGSWAAPSPEVTAAVLLAQVAAGTLAAGAMARRWRELVLPARGTDGNWHSMWWADPAYPTAVVGAAWAAAGRPALGAPHPTRPPDPRPGGPGWQLATWLWVAGAFGLGGADCAHDLLARRRADGGWAGGAELRVPSQRDEGTPRWTRDARGIFTTATALHAMLAAGLTNTAAVSGAGAPGAGASGAGASGGAAVSGAVVSGAAVSGVAASGAGVRGVARRGRVASARAAYDSVVSAMAAAGGVDARQLALPAFRALTRESLARRGVWPARQLSNLAGGTPLEFSVGAAPALRLTTEVGDPLLPPHGRVRSGLRAVTRAASLLGMAEAWRAVRPAVDVLTDQELPVPDGNRFWLWAGLDVTTGGRAVLKAYLSLQAEDVPGWRDRERAFLAACGVPAGAPAYAVLDRLAEDGWGHEVGVGLGTGGAWGIKVYYELGGYRAAVVRAVLDLCGLGGAGLVPEVPGVLRASLAAKRRAGIALRIDPPTGRVTEVTVAAAFPAPMVGRAELAGRVAAWLGPSGVPHDAALATLLPTWDDAPPQARLHSLFTRSRTRTGSDLIDETKVYLRPWLGPEHPCT